MVDNKRFIVLCIDPSTLPTAQQKGATVREINGHHVVQHYTKAKIKRASRHIITEVLRINEGQPHMRDGEDVDWFINVVFVYPLPKGYPKRRLGTFKRTRPDGDNMLKLLLDALTETKLFWSDDSQVQIDCCYRRYVTTGETPRILISIKNKRESKF